MRRALVALASVLILIPFAGCFGGPSDAGTPMIRVGSTTLGFDQQGRGDPAPVPLGDCDDVLEELNARVLGQAQARLDHALEQGHVYGPYWRFMEGDVMMAAGAPATDSAGGGASAADAEVTGTNNQEAGADEADLVKTDGPWTYVLSQGVLHVLFSDQVGDVELVHSMAIGQTWGGQLLLEKGDPDDPADDRLLVLVNARDPRGDAKARSERTGIADIWYPTSQYTRVLVLGLADRTDPEVLHERYIEGSVSGARLIDGIAHVVVTAWDPAVRPIEHLPVDDDLLASVGLNWSAYHQMDEDERRPVHEAAYRNATVRNELLVADLSVADHLPLALLPDDGGWSEEPVTRAVCGRVLSPEDGTGRSVNTVWSLDLEGDLDDRTIQVLGSSPIVYAAPGALVLAEQAQDWWWYWGRPQVEEATNLHWFDLDGLSVQHRASGRIAGTVQDSFSLDAVGDELRVITTTGQWGRWWLDDPEPMKNHLVVFQDDGDELVEVGAVSGFAEEERVWSARFTDHRAYVVTFRNIDPLWIIDLSEPTAPRILGELEIPGVSTYLHPIGDDRLLSIGIGPREDGGEQIGLDWSRTQVSLFDTSDPAKPVRLDVLDLSPGGDGWSWSGATHEHKAFTYWDKISMLAVPVTSTKVDQYREGNRYITSYEHHMALRLIEVEDDALRLYGDVDQDHLLSGERWWGGQIQRSHFLGFPDEWPERPVSVYAISDQGVTAHDLETLRLQGTAAFPEVEPVDY